MLVRKFLQDAFLLKDAPTNYNDGVTLQAGRKYLVEEGETFRGTLSGESSDGVTVYVAGTFEVSAWWLNGKDIRIVVLPTGTFRYASDLYNTSMALIKEGVTVDCWGTFAALHEGSGIRILRKASMNIYRSGHASSPYLNPKGRHVGIFVLGRRKLHERKAGDYRRKYVGQRW